jgi:MFS family permease
VSGYRKPSYTLILALASIGGALEFYDFVIFVYFTSVIAQVFFPPSLPEWVREVQTLAIFGAGYLARPLGGIVLAHIGDTQGRTRSFAVSLLLMALPTIAIGLLPTYASLGIAAPFLLLLMRVIQGIAVGGEVPGAWVFIAEHAGEKRTGFAIGLLSSGLVVGMLLGSLTTISLHAALAPAQMTQWGWRLPFLIGGAFGLVTVGLRRQLAETDVFQQMRDRGRLSRELPLRVVLRDHLRPFLASSCATCLVAGSTMMVLLMPPTLLKHSGVSMQQMQWANLAATVGSGCFAAILGAATDRFGIRSVAIPGLALLVGATYALYAVVPHNLALLFPVYLAAGIGSGTAALAPLLLVRAFPAAVRASGVSASYNITYAIAGGLTPTIIPWLAHFDSRSPAYWLAFTATLGLVAMFLVPQPSARPADLRLDAQPSDERDLPLQGRVRADLE